MHPFLFHTIFNPNQSVIRDVLQHIAVDTGQKVGYHCRASCEIHKNKIYSCDKRANVQAGDSYKTLRQRSFFPTSRHSHTRQYRTNL